MKTYTVSFQDSDEREFCTEEIEAENIDDAKQIVKLKYPDINDCIIIITLKLEIN